MKLKHRSIVLKATLKKIILAVKKALGLITPPVILPYRGFGNQHQVLVAGHVLDDRLLYEAAAQDRTYKNIRAMLSRYWSTSIPDIRVNICLLGQEAIVTTDENGLFEKVFEFTEPIAANGWQTVQYQVLDRIDPEQELMRAEGEVYIHSGQAEFGIISDVDDTILVSHATKTLKKLRLILTKNARTRLPFVGVSTFYKALQAGSDGRQKNPIFYVSSSAWNLYDFLVDFCRVRGIPKGPFLLKDLKTRLLQLYSSGGGSHDHKFEKISSLLQLYPQMRFLLIGDNGQHDPELYARAVREFPGRILAIYIRDVSVPEKAARVREIAGGLRRQSVEMIQVKDTSEAARHAQEQGWITPDGLDMVLEEMEKQKEKPQGFIGQIN
ncbi:App1 family protein [Flavilitoribacter nigricans]|uniref:Phosphatidate phosphatase APP1 catalytic domain-containing protein n=1 Tax=Flavilitoribacter nigricans (strain ATCC 23147 / DSM 23189 / NBRC 102662 / NCIMB 1420 / SS-2) TaxID=1122177 RepID=A0A2D0NJX2_FLAN2|nr:phosphatase domain-containing protein [Flavilitoribacter nigricans]PHN08499.1 hypothetical protein CRP01_00885 [Flavilitoribacter nigricans DSM 23189 = NBRC 102662]